jgi:hypothetical protein
VIVGAQGGRVGEADDVRAARGLRAHGGEHRGAVGGGPVLARARARCEEERERERNGYLLLALVVDCELWLASGQRFCQRCETPPASQAQSFNAVFVLCCVLAGRATAADARMTPTGFQSFSVPVGAITAEHRELVVAVPSQPTLSAGAAASPAQCSRRFRMSASESLVVRRPLCPFVQPF